MPTNGRPSYRQLAAALRRAEACLRTAASQWPDIPGRTRIRLLRCADSAKAMLIRAGNGK
jgi:hypothetical protein